MNRSMLQIVFGTLLTLAAAAPRASAADSRLGAAGAFPRELVGAWRLLSIEDRHDGKPGFHDPDLGPRLTGYLIVDERGIACLQGMKIDRPRWAATDGRTAPSDT